MDEQVQQAIQGHEDYQRLKGVFSLDFLVDCFTNPRRGIQGSARLIGKLLKDYGDDPSLFVAGIHYHELIELEEKRKMGYSDNQLGDSNANDRNYEGLHILSKKKELGFHQVIGKQATGVELPFLAIVLSYGAAMTDYGIPAPSYGDFYKLVQSRIRNGIPEFADPIDMKMVQQGIQLFKLGGDRCSGEPNALSLSEEYTSGRQPPRQPSILDVL